MRVEVACYTDQKLQRNPRFPTVSTKKHVASLNVLMPLPLLFRDKIANYIG